MTAKSKLKVAYLSSLRQDFIDTKPCLMKDSYFRFVFNFLYCTFICPFWVAEEKKTGEYVIKSNSLQKIICVNVHFWNFISAYGYMVTPRFENLILHSSIRRLLVCIGYMTSSLALVDLLRKIWLWQDDLLAFMNATRCCRISGKACYSVGLLVFLCYMSSIYLTETATYPEDIFGNDVVSKFSLVLRIDLLSQIAYYLIQGPIAIANFSLPISRLLIMVMTLQFKCLINEFEKSIETVINIDSAVMLYQNLKHKFELGMKWANHFLVFNHICLVIFLANLPDALREKDPTRKQEKGVPGIGEFLFAVQFGLYGTCLLMACDIPKKVKAACKGWILRKRLHTEYISIDEKIKLLAFARDVEEEELGLSCSFFTVTYNFIGSMLGLVTTYGVLVFQK